MFRFISPLKNPLFSDQSGGLRSPYWIYPLGWVEIERLSFWREWLMIGFPRREVCSSSEIPAVTSRRLRGSPVFRRRVTSGVNCSLRRCRASSQSPFRSNPPDGNFSLHSLAPPFQTEPASLGFGLGYCAGTMRAGALKPGSQPTKAASAEGPNGNLPSARGRRWGLSKRRPGTYKTQCALLEHRRAVRRRQTVPTRPEILLPPMGPSNDFPRGAHHPLGPPVLASPRGRSSASPRHGTGQARLQTGRTAIFLI